MKKENNTLKFSKLFWVFVIGCIIGYIMEVTLNLIRTHNFETRQGLIYGPFAPVYGLGMLAFYLILPKIKNLGGIFLASALLRGHYGILMFIFSRKMVWNNFLGLFTSVS